jgi:hypothetical protein
VAEIRASLQLYKHCVICTHRLGASGSVSLTPIGPPVGFPPSTWGFHLQLGGREGWHRYYDHALTGGGSGQQGLLFLCSNILITQSSCPVPTDSGTFQSHCQFMFMPWFGWSKQLPNNHFLLCCQTSAANLSKSQYQTIIGSAADS